MKTNRQGGKCRGCQRARMHRCDAEEVLFPRKKVKGRKKKKVTSVTQIVIHIPNSQERPHIVAANKPHIISAVL